MKKSFYLLIVVPFLLLSCENNRIEENNDNSSKSTLSEMPELLGSEIALMKDSVVQLTVSESSVMAAAKSFFKKTDLQTEPVSFKIIDVNNNKYLRFYNEDNTLSTIELIVDSTSHKIILGSTICTSDVCVSGGGCVPDGVYCTECNGGLGDCKRTTSS